jgi:hypothetical protein
MRFCARYLGALTAASLLVACARPTRENPLAAMLSTRLSTPPPAGPTCFEATDHLLREGAAYAASDQALRWLVLLPPSAPDSSGFLPAYRSAYLVPRRGRGVASPAAWRRRGDSVEVVAGVGLASATWRLAERGDTLVGYAEMEHDTYHVDSAGRRVPGRSRWGARATRVPCRRVP